MAKPERPGEAARHRRGLVPRRLPRHARLRAPRRGDRPRDARLQARREQGHHGRVPEQRGVRIDPRRRLLHEGHATTSRTSSSGRSWRTRRCATTLRPMYERMRKPDMTDEETRSGARGEHRLPERPDLGELAPGDHPRVHPPCSRQKLGSLTPHPGARRDSGVVAPSLCSRFVNVGRAAVAYHGCGTWTHDGPVRARSPWAARSSSAASSASTSASTGAGSSSSSSSPGRSRRASSTSSTPTGRTPQRWIGGALIAGVFFLSILAHELSHAIVSNRAGLPVRSITLFVFGGVSNLTKRAGHAGLEFRIAIVGPLTSLVLGRALRGGVGGALPVNDGARRHLRLPGADQRVARRLQHAAGLPAGRRPRLPLDRLGAQQEPAARHAHRVAGRASGSPTASWRSASSTRSVSGLFSGLWFLLIGFFLRNASAVSYEQLADRDDAERHRRRATSCRRTSPRVPPDLSVEELVHEHVLRAQRALLRRHGRRRLRRPRHADRRPQGAARRSGRRRASIAR